MRRPPLLGLVAWWQCARVVVGHGTLLESLQSDDFVPYLGYDGDLVVTGQVGPLTSDLWTQTFRYALAGVDERCADGPAPGVADSCGLHVHYGVSCAKKSGFAYFGEGVTVDPWPNVTYAAVATSMGTVASGEVVITTGFPHVDLEDRPVIVFDYEGARVACSMLRSMAPLGALDFIKYHDYDGDLEVVGRVAPLVTEHSVVAVTLFTYDLGGLDPRCAGGPDYAAARDSCGLGVHENTNCFEDVGAHLYDFVPDDPWANISYTAGPDGRAAAKVTLKTGLRQPAMEGRAFVVRDFLGARVACATLGLTPALEAAEFRPAFGARGAAAVSGSVGPVTTENHKPVQKFAFALEGGDPACADGPDEAVEASCGIRIHAAESCLESPREPFHAVVDARGRRITRDPWAASKFAYVPDASGVAQANVTLKIGRTQPELENRALLVYDRGGAALACALLTPILRVVAVSADGSFVYGRVAPRLTQLGF